MQGNLLHTEIIPVIFKCVGKGRKKAKDGKIL